MGVNDLDVKHTIDMESHIVFGNSYLGGDLNSLLSHVVHVLNCVYQGNLEVEAWFQLSVELLESMKEDGVVLWHDD